MSFSVRFACVTEYKIVFSELSTPMIFKFYCKRKVQTGLIQIPKQGKIARNMRLLDVKDIRHAHILYHIRTASCLFMIASRTRMWSRMLQAMWSLWLPHEKHGLFVYILVRLAWHLWKDFILASGYPAEKTLVEDVLNLIIIFDYHRIIQLRKVCLHPKLGHGSVNRCSGVGDTRASIHTAMTHTQIQIQLF